VTCRAAVLRLATGPGTEHDDAFLELARRGDETTFKDLARCLGADVQQTDELWRRARACVPVPPAGPARTP
jgi:hypothetical protein